MALDRGTFDYLKPTDEQVDKMAELRAAARTYSQLIEVLVPDGPDRTYLLRKLREVGMWANVAVTRDESGTPRP